MARLSEQLVWIQYQVFMYTLDSTFVQFQLWIFYRLEKGKYKLSATQKWVQKGISRLIWNCFFFKLTVSLVLNNCA